MLSVSVNHGKNIEFSFGVNYTVYTNGSTTPLVNLFMDLTTE